MTGLRPARPTPKRLAVLLAFAALAANGCGTGRTARAERRARELGVSIVREPSRFGEMDIAVREQYTELRARLVDSLNDESAAPEAVGQAFGALGNWHLIYRLHELARPCYFAARRLDPRDARWFYFLGLTERELGHLTAAAAALDQANALRPQQLGILVTLGELELERGRCRAAEARFRSALSIDPLCIRALANLGLALNACHRPQEAIPILERALRLQPESLFISYQIGTAHRAAGDPERARRYLEPLAGLEASTSALPMRDPMRAELGAMDVSARMLKLRAHSALEAGRIEAAIELLRQAIRANPERTDSVADLAETLIKAGRESEAIVELRGILRRQPDARRARRLLAEALRRLGQLRAAERELLTCLLKDPRDKGTHLQLAGLLRSSGRLAEAAQHYARAVELDPLDSDARYWQVAALHALGRDAQAHRALDQALAAHPENPALLLLARSLTTTDSEARGPNPPAPNP